MKSLKILAFVAVIAFAFYSKGYGQTAKYQKLVYEWNVPKGDSTYPAILVLGGSEGGKGYGQNWAKVLCSKGFGVMALSYFNQDGLNEQLEEIPIEYFQKALDTLKSFKGVDRKRIAIISMSKGTEPALLLGIDNLDIKLIVAASPSNLIWQGINRTNYKSVKSSWTINNQPLQFEPYDYSNGYYPVVNFYLAAMENPSNSNAVIPVEKIKAKLIVLSGGKDMIWPSTKMADKIVERYKTTHKSDEIISINFPNAGHGFLLPFDSEIDRQILLEKIKSNIGYLGGTIDDFDYALKIGFDLVMNELKKL